MDRTSTSSASDARTDLYRPTFAEIDADAYGRNLVAIHRYMPPDARLIAVLKADGYGHGAAELARECERGPVAMIAVALLEEALEIRAAGVTLPILILGAIPPAQVRIAIESGCTLGIPGPEALASLIEAAGTTAKCRIHVKLDSGMNRMGFTEEDLASLAETLRRHPNLEVEALYTHFANSGDARDPFTLEQVATYELMLQRLSELGVEAPVHHTSNSAAIVRGFASPGDFVRAGLILYGAEPLDEGTSALEPVMTWRTQIARIKNVATGGAVGYGSTWRARRDSRIATLPVGYADGYSRLHSNNGEVLLHGRRVPVVGRVSMDLVTIDVSDVPEAAPGDPVVLLGAQGNERITAEELARKTSTISYEVFCRVSARVPRLYRRGDRLAISSRFSALMNGHDE